MTLLGNLIWLICGGLVSALLWIIAGFLCSITVVGLPLGLQCFKFAGLSASPFGREVIYNGGAVSFLVNVLWFLCCGIWLAGINFCLGIFMCITIIGIPFGRQFFKLAKLSLAPFGAVVY